MIFSWAQLAIGRLGVWVETWYCGFAAQLLLCRLSNWAERISLIFWLLTCRDKRVMQSNVLQFKSFSAVCDLIYDQIFFWVSFLIICCKVIVWLVTSWLKQLEWLPACLLRYYRSNSELWWCLIVAYCSFSKWEFLWFYGNVKWSRKLKT